MCDNNSSFDRARPNNSHWRRIWFKTRLSRVHVVVGGQECKGARTTRIELRLTIVSHETVENVKQNLYSYFTRPYTPYSSTCDRSVTRKLKLTYMRVGVANHRSYG